MQILLAGTPHTTVIVAEALVGGGHTIQGVLCPFPKPVGRKQLITPCALELWAKERAIPVFNVDKNVFQKEEFHKNIPSADVMVVADFGYLIPSWLLQHPKHGALNLHPSLLPRWRGATPVPFTLLFGDKETAITIIHMNERFDMGGIVAQETFAVLGTDTTPTLLERAFHKGADLLVRILPEFVVGTLHETPQPTHTQTPQTRKFTKEDGCIPFEALQMLSEHKDSTTTIPLLQSYAIPTTLESIDRMIRALTPWPCAWTILPTGKRAKFIKSHIEHIENDTLVFDEVRIEGEPPMRNLLLKSLLEIH